MKIIKHLALVDFNFWSGATQHSFTEDELNKLDDALTYEFEEGLDETCINDMFWFEEEYLCELINLDYNEYNERVFVSETNTE